MTVNINASLTQGLVLTSDTSGVVAFQSNNAETMRIDTSGNVGIGTSSPSSYAYNDPAPLVVANTAGGSTVSIASGATSFGQLAFANGTSGTSRYNGYIKYDHASNFMAFYTNAGAERMRIDSSGNLLVGTTASNARLSVDGAGNTSSGYTLYIRNSTPNDLLYLRNDGFFSTGNAGSSPYNATTATAANVVVASNGQLQRSTSSLKYKTDVVDATHGLAEVLQLRPVTYKGKNDGETVFGGLIAEEVDAVGLTEFVQYAEDGSPDALAYGNMVSLLVKSIQEQQSIISDLQSRIAALEAK